MAVSSFTGDGVLLKRRPSVKGPPADGYRGRTRTNKVEIRRFVASLRMTCIFQCPEKRLAVDGELGAPVFLPACFVGFGAELFFLAVADHPDAGWSNAGVDEAGLCCVGAIFT